MSAAPVVAGPAPVPAAICAFPATSASDRVYAFAEPLSRDVHDYTRCSRFVLSDGGRFSLQFGMGSGAYPGRYSAAGSTLGLTWEGRSSAGPWESAAQVTDGTLTVRYGVVMSLSDFEDGIYRLVESHAPLPD